MQVHHVEAVVSVLEDRVVHCASKVGQGHVEDMQELISKE